MSEYNSSTKILLSAHPFPDVLAGLQPPGASLFNVERHNEANVPRKKTFTISAIYSRGRVLRPREGESEGVRRKPKSWFEQTHINTYVHALECVCVRGARGASACACMYIHAGMCCCDYIYVTCTYSDG